MSIINTALTLQTLGTLAIVCPEKVRFMSVITPAHAHEYQTICLGIPFPGVPHYSFRLPLPESRYPFLPSDRSLSKKLGHDYRGWANYQDGGTLDVDGETVNDGRNFPIPRGRIYVMFGPSSTPKPIWFFFGARTHSKTPDARTHSNNTAELTTMIETLVFCGLRSPVTPMNSHVFS